MTGNIVNLYAMKLGATSELIGILAAMSSLNFLFSFIGLRFIYRLGAVKLMGTFWFFRYLMMIPLLFTVFPAIRAIPLLPLVLITGGTLFFNICKGIALSAGKPIVGSLAHDKERARFSSGNQTMSFVGTTLANLYIALMLGQESPFHRYILIIATGITAGITASFIFLKLPEPDLEIKKRANFLEGVAEGFRKKSFRELMIIMIITNIGSTLTNPFFVVYCKQGLSLTDQTVVIISTLSSLGVLFVAYLSRFLMDRVGSKPLFFTFNLIKVMLLIMVIFTPVSSRPLFLSFYMTMIFLLNRMCFQGILSSSDIYFFVTSTPEERINQGVVFNLIRGLTGLLGSAMGGFLLGYLQKRLASPTVPFQYYFAFGMVFHLTALFLIHRLPDVSRFSIKSVLGILISPRDLRAIWHLNRLDQSSSPEEEGEILNQIKDNKSDLTREELQSRLESPSMFIRMQAIEGLKNFDITDEAEDMLMDQVKNQPFTSGSQAASILGDLGIRKSIPLLREALDSPDYLVKSKASLSLGKLGDKQSIGKIEKNLIQGENPRIKLYSARALELLGSTSSIPLILETIGKDNIPHFNEELILIISGLLDFTPWFFSRFSIYLKDGEEGWEELNREWDDPRDFISLRDRCLSRPEALKQEVRDFCRHSQFNIKKDPLLSSLKEGDDRELVFLALARLTYRLTSQE